MLGNPLGGVVWATAMLKTFNGQNGMQMGPVEIPERPSRQMDGWLDDLLEASRVTQKKIERRRDVVDLRTIASEAADAVRIHAWDRLILRATAIPSTPGNMLIRISPIPPSNFDAVTTRSGMTIGRFAGTDASGLGDSTWVHILTMQRRPRTYRPL
jgi:hypothetical protein